MGKSQVSDLSFHLNIFENLIQSKTEWNRDNCRTNQNIVKTTEKTDEAKDFSWKDKIHNLLSRLTKKRERHELSDMNKTRISSRHCRHQVIIRKSLEPALNAWSVATYIFLSTYKYFKWKTNGKNFWALDTINRCSNGH